MKLAAIVVVWDDWEMLGYFLKSMAPMVDGVIVVWSRMSNYGEAGESTESVLSFRGNIVTVNHEPDLKKDARLNETAKRNAGLQKARELGYTHFLCCDTDEFYDALQFGIAKNRFKNEPGLLGLVCASKVYFKSPTLTIGFDTTRVPFIHKLTSTIQHSFNKNYPYAWEGREIRIDPTRSFNLSRGIEWTDDVVMHHMSYVRRDFAKKIRNSTARVNLERSSILEDLLQAKPGYFCKFYGKVLHTVPNYFNLPTYDVVV